MATLVSLPFRLVMFVIKTIGSVFSFLWSFLALLLNPANMVVLALIVAGLYYWLTQ